MAKIAKGVDLEYTRGRVTRIGFVSANEDLDTYQLDRLLDKHWSLAQTMGYGDYRQYVLDNELVESVTYSKTEEQRIISRRTPMMRLRRALSRMLDPGDGRQS